MSLTTSSAGAIEEFGRETIEHKGWLVAGEFFARLNIQK